MQLDVTACTAALGIEYEFCQLFNIHMINMTYERAKDTHMRQTEDSISAEKFLLHISILHNCIPHLYNLMLIFAQYPNIFGRNLEAEVYTEGD